MWRLRVPYQGKRVPYGELPTNLAMMKAFRNWMVAEGYMAENPIATWVTDVGPVEDRVRPVVVPDYTFIGILSDMFGTHDFRNRSSRNGSGYVGVSWQQSTKRWIAYDKKKYLGLFKTAEEAGEAVRAAKSLGGETTDRLVFELLLGTAGRRSEVAGFRMMDVDLTAKGCWAREPVVLINGKPVRQPVPKGGKARSMRIGPDLAGMIHVERARRGVTDPLAPLVTGPRGALLNFDNWIDDRPVPALDVAIARRAPLEAKRLMKEAD